MKTSKRIKRSEPEVLFARLWFACSAAEGAAPRTVFPEAPRTVFLECERWFDARTIARALLGSEASVVAIVPGTARALPSERVQVRWVGSAARRVPDLRLQTRTLPGGAWEDFR